MEQLTRLTAIGIPAEIQVLPDGYQDIKLTPDMNPLTITGGTRIALEQERELLQHWIETRLTWLEVLPRKHSNVDPKVLDIKTKELRLWLNQLELTMAALRPAEMGYGRTVSTAPFELVRDRQN